MIHPLFSYHKLNEGGVKKAEECAVSFTNLLRELESMCPQGRELALVKTKLEEASFFAKKAIASEPVNQA